LRRLAIIVGASLAVASVSAVLAQTVEGLDLDAIRARSAEHRADAEALAGEVVRRAESFREDAEEIRKNGLAAVKALDPKSLPAGPAGPVDFDEIVTAASENLTDKRGQAPLFMVFVSLSMPEAALKPIIRDVSQAGGLVVFRGFPGNSAKQFVARLSKVVDDQSQFASIGIDPRLFRAFDVSAVPTYVVASTDFDLCDGLTCKTLAPPHDAMAGNVSTRYALSTFSDDSGPGALVARTALRNLEGAAR
jgi:conjugal transfer pilus assembly protein TrbC